ncbi:MAG TPA: sigma 54-interacting transcriptional regulator [Dissulfurispiraceae bacterium]|nr:sigma 54-interacting transcriptional regulator [Dissulfurispiraceae bacterium]
MKVPVFKHTVLKISAALQDDKKSLQSISGLIQYDPGLYFSLLRKISAASLKSEVTVISQAVSLLGANAIEAEIVQHSMVLDDEVSLALWCSAILAGEAAIRVNEISPVAESEEVFFAALMPTVGMLLMLGERPEYRRLIPLMLKLSIEDRAFLENRLFRSNHISALDNILSMPQLYRDIIGFIKAERFPDILKEQELPAPTRLSAAHTASQLYHLAETAEQIAQSILFPAGVLAQENLKQFNKRYFKIIESDTEELLADVVERFEDACSEFDMREFADRLLAAAGTFHEPDVKFLTTSAPMLRVLNEVFSDSETGRNFLVWGEAGVGKRLLAVALHDHPDNPRHDKPFLAFHCDTVDTDTLEEELFGSGGGFWGSDQHKGAFDLADGGTIMLKNIDRMPMPLQERLAEIITRIDYYRSRSIKASYPDVLFILTSRKNLEVEAQEERFSKALLRALKPQIILVPPLRDRREDIGFIANGIIKKYDLPLTDTVQLLSLQEFYDTYAFKENLSDLKRLLFYAAAKKMLKS